MTRDDLTKLDTVNYEAAKRLIEAGKEHAPMILCFPEGPFVDVSGIMSEVNGERGKNMVGALIRGLTREYAVVVFICEAWALNYNLKDAPPTLRPSEHPDRMECVTVSYTTQELGYAVAHHRIIREGALVHLERGPLMFPEQAEGRFVA